METLNSLLKEAVSFSSTAPKAQVIPIRRLALKQAISGEKGLPLAVLNYLEKGDAGIKRSDLRGLLLSQEGYRAGIAEAIKYTENLLKILEHPGFKEAIIEGRFTLGAIKPDLGSSVAYDYVHGEAEHPDFEHWVPGDAAATMSEDSQIFDSDFAKYLFNLIPKRSRLAALLPFSYRPRREDFDSSYRHIKNKQGGRIYRDLAALFREGGPTTAFILQRKDMNRDIQAFEEWRRFMGPSRNPNEATREQARTIFAPKPYTEEDGPVQNGFHGGRDVGEVLKDLERFKIYIERSLGALTEISRNAR